MGPPPVEVVELLMGDVGPLERPPPPGARVLGLRFHGTPAGVAWLAVEGSRARAHVEVDRGHRGLGLGKMLLAAVETRARGLGATTLELESGPEPRPWSEALLRSLWAREGGRILKRLD